jgi:hypothetical protein
MRLAPVIQVVLITCLCVSCSAARAPAQAPPVAAPGSEAPAASRASASPAATEPSPGPAEVECKLSCQPPRMIARAAPDPDYTQREIDNANTVLAGMTDDLLGCYKKRLRVNPKAHGLISVEIMVGSDGHVRKVDTSGATILGSTTMACIVHRIEQGVFEPPHGGGNIHVQVPFTLSVVTEGDQT